MEAEKVEVAVFSMKDQIGAPQALQLIMQHHDSKFWKEEPEGEYKIGIPIKGKGGRLEFRTVLPEMLAAAKRQIEAGTPGYRGELDFPDVIRQTRSTGKRRGNSGR